MGSEPMVRASIPKSSWTEIAGLPSSKRADIEAALGAAFVAELDTALTVSWVPFSVEARLADAIYEVLGGSDAREFYRKKTMHSFEIPLIKPVLESSLRLFGATPVSFLKMLGRTWSMVSRDCGRYDWVDERSERRGISVVSGWPTALYRQEQAWLESSLGGYQAFFAPFRLEGRVHASDVDFAGGNARFVLEW